MGGSAKSRLCYHRRHRPDHSQRSSNRLPPDDYRRALLSMVIYAPAKKASETMQPLSFEHIGVAVENLQQSIDSYRELFGYRVLSGPFCDSIKRVTVCFLGTGEPHGVVIELVAALTDDAPIKRLLTRGGGAYHICYAIADIEQAVADFRAKGSLIVTPPVPAVAFAGRRIAWLYTPGRQLVELLEDSPVRAYA